MKIGAVFLVNTNDGPDPSGNYYILNRGKRHDYFTSFALATEGPFR